MLCAAGRDQAVRIAASGVRRFVFLRWDSGLQKRRNDGENKRVHVDTGMQDPCGACHVSSSCAQVDWTDDRVKEGHKKPEPSTDEESAFATGLTHVRHE